MPRFYWLIEGELAGCSRPGGDPREGAGRAQQGAVADTLDRDLAWLRHRGIGAVLTLTETSLATESLDRHGLTALHLPVPDLHAPGPDQLMRALAFVDMQRALGRAVVVHCLVGAGRTGTILAAYRIRGGVTPEQAVHEIRAICPGAIGSPDQERALHAFARRRDWIM